MKKLRLVEAKEISPDGFGEMVASALNCRFMSFLLELSKKLDVHAGDVFAAGEIILRDAEISQEGFIDDIVKMDQCVSAMGRQLAVSKRYPCYYNTSKLERSVDEVVKLWAEIMEA